MVEWAAVSILQRTVGSYARGEADWCLLSDYRNTCGRA